MKWTVGGDYKSQSQTPIGIQFVCAFPQVQLDNETGKPSQGKFTTSWLFLILFPLFFLVHHPRLPAEPCFGP